MIRLQMKLYRRHSRVATLYEFNGLKILAYFDSCTDI